MSAYDCIVLGAGIAGSSAAYFLKEKGLKVLVVDRAGIAHTGGSAAAGAFVSPKIGKGSPLQQLTNEAFVFAKDFYLDKFPQHFAQTGVVRIPKDDEDAQKFPIYEEHNYAHYRWVKGEALRDLGIIDAHGSFLFEEAGVCSPSVCEAMLDEVDFIKADVKQLVYEDEAWVMGGYQAPKLVLATGYE
ncbi:MAG TPA: FAD-dependent oxidoreductase, partial [Campylobacterales bacterium]|nr:FAD-dependent oxidoreductase [Campylobacterales bacterium]